LSGADELDEATGPNGEKLFSFCVVALQRSTAANISRTKALGSTADGRVRHDWKQIEQILKEEYGHIRSKPTRTKAELLNRVEERLGDNSPGRTSLYERIKHLFPDF
jgi:hypothetical protein